MIKFYSLILLLIVELNCIILAIWQLYHRFSDLMDGVKVAFEQLLKLVGIILYFPLVILIITWPWCAIIIVIYTIRHIVRELSKYYENRKTT
jgi:hypothetical protein